jgi:hypothetical protein
MAKPTTKPEHCGMPVNPALKNLEAEEQIEEGRYDYDYLGEEGEQQETYVKKAKNDKEGNLTDCPVTFPTKRWEQKCQSSGDQKCSTIEYCGQISNTPEKKLQAIAILEHLVSEPATEEHAEKMAARGIVSNKKVKGYYLYAHKRGGRELEEISGIPATDQGVLNVYTLVGFCTPQLVEQVGLMQPRLEGGSTRPFALLTTKRGRKKKQNK